ncbi:hypothetical protein Tco_0831193 [Tanacetum coccineum]
MENEHELTYETLTSVYLGSYEHYKSVGAEVEHPEPGFELQGAKMVEMGRFRTHGTSRVSGQMTHFVARQVLTDNLSLFCWCVNHLLKDVIVVELILIVCWAYALHQDKASLVRVPVANVTLNFSGTSIPIGIVGICHGSSFMGLDCGSAEYGRKPSDLSCMIKLVKVEFIRISLTRFRNCTSRSRYQSILKQTTRLIHIESRKPPTKSLFDVGSRRISIVTVNTKEYHSDVLAVITRIIRRTY